MAIKDRFIPREEISNLLWNMDSEISTHSLSMWLKSQTDDKWVVVPKSFCELTIQLFDGDFSEYFRSKIEGFEEAIENINSIKNYL
jgi:hypothetical protein